MGFMNWLMKGAGFETEEVYDNSIEKQKMKEEKLLKKEERQRRKADNRAFKVQKKAEKVAKKYSLQPPSGALNDNGVKQKSSQTASSTSYAENPDQYNMSRYESPIKDYGIKSSNVGGFGTKSVEFLNPTRYEDVGTVIHCLKEGESVMLNLSQMTDFDSQRLLDCAYGAVYALNGNIRRVDSNIFFVTPEGFNIKMPGDLNNQNNIGGQNY